MKYPMVKTFQFWIVTLSALAVASLTFGLGLWQLDRAAQKEKISLAQRQQTIESLTGQWATEHSIYLDNRQMNTPSGQALQGFYVVTPLFINAQDFVLVQRGWIARDFQDRRKLQSVETPAGPVSLTALRMTDPVVPDIYQNESASDYQREMPIAQYVKLVHFQQVLPQARYLGMWRQIEDATANSSDGLKRHWPEPASGVAKHHAYAFQWFALCALVLGLYVWFQLIVPFKKRKQSPAV
jgi:surfeit locus 1 family protein